MTAETLKARVDQLYESSRSDIDWTFALPDPPPQLPNFPPRQEKVHEAIERGAATAVEKLVAGLVQRFAELTKTSGTPIYELHVSEQALHDFARHHICTISPWSDYMAKNQPDGGYSMEEMTNSIPFAEEREALVVSRMRKLGYKVGRICRPVRDEKGIVHICPSRFIFRLG